MQFLLQLYWPGFRELSELSEEDGVSQTKSKKISHIPHVVSTHRVFNVQLGERSKLAWLGVEADPLLQSDDLLKKAQAVSGCQ
ncbi:hypothetical protein WN944_006431 [Citrus x changshan-huyou]|uniref:Uncharacterized protein n=1 Tax=Citrus x changshan-huyou TaxID=2935761 RepID=A0AAP0QTU4_9ROSI